MEKTKITRIQERQFLNFFPPKLNGNISEERKRRYMLVLENNIDTNTIKLINISKLSGKAKCLWYDYNIEIIDYYPLKKPSFAKLNTIYTIKEFGELNKYVSFGGKKLSEKEFNNIKVEMSNYYNKIKKKNIIEFTQKDFIESNKELITK